MGRKMKLTKAQIMEAVPGCLGIVANVYRKLGIGRRTFYEYRERWPEIQQAIDDELAHGLDYAESKLMKLIEQGDFKAISFYLERRGANRGWGQQRDVSLNSNSLIQPIIVFDDEQKADDADRTPRDKA